MKITLYLPSGIEINTLTFAEGVHAGFPSPAADYNDKLDLGKELIKHPASTFFARVEGDSMKDACINDSDILIIDRSIEPKDGDMAICYIDGEFNIRYIRIRDNKVWLDSANKNYKPIEVFPETDFIVWGIITYSISKHYNR